MEAARSALHRSRLGDAAGDAPLPAAHGQFPAAPAGPGAALAPLRQHSAPPRGKQQDELIIYSAKVISTVLIGLAEGFHPPLVCHPISISSWQGAGSSHCKSSA